MASCDASYIKLCAQICVGDILCETVRIDVGFDGELGANSSEQGCEALSGEAMVI